MFVDKNTVRRILENQVEIMNALATLASRPDAPCDASKSLLQRAAHETANLMIAKFPKKL